MQSVRSRMSLASHPLLRRLLLPLFARLNPGDITIKHHHTLSLIHISEPTRPY